MTKIECPLDTCINIKDGICQLENVCLKWRFAGDFGKGAVVFVECLMFEVGDRKEYLKQKELKDEQADLC